MANESPAQAINVVKRVVEMCDFIEHPTIQEAIQQKLVPRPLPPAFNAVVDISVWVGLGTVGLWAALDSFAERACLKGPIQTRFRCQDNEGLSLLELEDIRHLYAHNYAGVADDKYFTRPRHVLRSGKVVQLTCGAQFDGRRLSLDLHHLRVYARIVQSILERSG